MSTTSAILAEPESSPLDIVERVLEALGLEYDRNDEDVDWALVSAVAYSLSFSLLNEGDLLHLACAFDFCPASARIAEVDKFIALVNRGLTLGHFDRWQENGTVAFRCAMPMRGVSGPASKQCEDMIDMAVRSCDQYYQAFNFVAWSRCGAEEAFKSAEFVVEGEA